MTSPRATLAFALALAVLAGFWIYFSVNSPPTPQCTFFPSTDFAHSTHGVYTFFNILLLTIFIVFEGALVYTMFRYRRRGDELPAQTYGNIAVELGGTLATAVLVIILFIPSCQQIAVQQGPAPEGAMQIDVVGKQWWWEFYYPEYDLVVPNELHVPSGRPVKLHLTASDVIHSFWVPRLGGKRDLVPGRTQSMWFTPGKPGVYDGQCAEYCGTSHANMSMQVVVQKPEEFEAWVTTQKAPAPEALAHPGFAVFGVSGCIACHSVFGNDKNFRGMLGPNLTKVGDRRMIAAGLLDNNENELYRWIKNPQAIKPGVLMNVPAAQCEGLGVPDPCCRGTGIGNCLSDDTVNQLVAFLTSLR